MDPDCQIKNDIVCNWIPHLSHVLINCSNFKKYFRGISWATKEKVHKANYFGSLTQSSTIRVGSYNGEEIYAPFKSLVPMVTPSSQIKLLPLRSYHKISPLSTFSIMKRYIKNDSIYGFWQCKNILIIIRCAHIYMDLRMRTIQPIFL